MTTSMADDYIDAPCQPSGSPMVPPLSYAAPLYSILHTLYSQIIPQDYLSSPIISTRFLTTISEASFCTWFVPSQVS